MPSVLPFSARGAAPNPLIRKLAHATPLSIDDRARLTEVCARTRVVNARCDIIQEGDPPDAVHLVLDGFACRYKMLANGARQNTALFLPGDFCDLHVAILDRMDHSIATIAPCTVVDIPRDTILDLTHNHPRIAHALWWCTLVDEAVLREWLVNMGQREAVARIAHFLCEIVVRLHAVGRGEEGGCVLPLTQSEIADTLGMTAVHVNRSLQALRAQNLIVLTRRRLSVPNFAALKACAGFDPSYLHLRDSRSSA